MTRNLKRFGVALVAVFAMSVVVASAANAQPKFTVQSGKYPQNVSGGQTTEHKFTAGIRTVTCKTANFTGKTANEASSDQTITPEYKECTATGGLPVTVTHTATYTFTVQSYDKAEGEVPEKWTGDVEIIGDMVVDIYGSAAAHAEKKPPVCKITVGAQTLTGITFTNSAGGILAAANVTPAVTIEGSALVCGTGTTATYTGSTLITAAGETLDVGGV